MALTKIERQIIELYQTAMDEIEKRGEGLTCCTFCVTPARVGAFGNLWNGELFKRQFICTTCIRQLAGEE